jgi:poly(ADP-ribose) glycohydrolase ARH3
MVSAPRNVPLADRFTGCLLGLAVGDALGGRFEGQTADAILRRFPTPQALFAAPWDTLHYTDDTQMALGVAEALVEDGEVREPTLCRVFATNYVPSRGYGWGARMVLEAMEEGGDYRAVATTHFPGGSFGNGAAMRVAPVGLFFHQDLGKVWEQAERSALPTHLHRLGIEGAQLLAVAVALCLREETWDRETLFSELLRRCRSAEFQAKLEQAAQLPGPEELVRLGNGIQALESVVTALACFASAPQDYGTAVGRAILLGGDTDTIGAMTGSLSGTFLGPQAIPAGAVAALEDHPRTKGRTYLTGLAAKLLARRISGQVTTISPAP